MSKNHQSKRRDRMKLMKKMRQETGIIEPMENQSKKSPAENTQPDEQSNNQAAADLIYEITVLIRGMHCRSCELLIEANLKKIPGVRKINVSYLKHRAIIFSSQKIDYQLIQQMVEEAGYEVGSEEKKSWFTDNPEVYTDLSIGLILFIILYLILNKLDVTNISGGSLTNPSSLFVVLLIGLTAGFSSCMALVGGLVLGISARHAEKHPEATISQKFRPHLFFNLGRISSYFLLGGVIGIVGKAFQLSGPTLGWLIIGVGLVMLLLGLQLTELSPRLANFKLTLPSFISRRLGMQERHTQEYSHTNSIVTGALTFFLPCGFTQAMQLYAMTTGSFWKGAIVMGLFAIGTAPGLLCVGGLTSIVKGAFARRFFKFAGIVVTVLAIFNLSNGWNLTGLSLGSTSSVDGPQSADKIDPNVSFKDGYQIVKMDQLATGYQPNTFTIKNNIPVKWVVNSKEPGSCAASLYMGDYNIRKFLKSGENIIEFTPTKTGTIAFSCSMGMYRGTFEVVDGGTDQTAPGDTRSPDQTSETVSDEDPSLTPIGPPPEAAANPVDEQVIKAVYTKFQDIQPADFTVKTGVPVRFEIKAEDDGSGCMSSITVPALTEDYDELTRGKTTVLKFTPDKPGKYKITCAMGVPRGTITAQ